MQNASRMRACHTPLQTPTHFILSLPRMIFSVGLLPIMFTVPVYPPVLRQMLHWQSWTMSVTARLV